MRVARRRRPVRATKYLTVLNRYSPSRGHARSCGSSRAAPSVDPPLNGSSDVNTGFREFVADDPSAFRGAVILVVRSDGYQRSFRGSCWSHSDATSARYLDTLFIARLIV